MGGCVVSAHGCECECVCSVRDGRGCRSDRGASARTGLGGHSTKTRDLRRTTGEVSRSAEEEEEGRADLLLVSGGNREENYKGHFRGACVRATVLGLIHTLVKKNRTLVSFVRACLFG